MSFAKLTGRNKTGLCDVCGQNIEMQELEQWNRQGHVFVWHPLPHRAPCGAHCIGGDYDEGETDVHIPYRGVCPRCGAQAIRMIHILEHVDAGERAVFYQYTADYDSAQPFLFELEKLKDGSWVASGSWGLHRSFSLEEAVPAAAVYFPWIVDSTTD